MTKLQALPNPGHFHGAKTHDGSCSEAYFRHQLNQFRYTLDAKHEGTKEAPTNPNPGDTYWRNSAAQLATIDQRVNETTPHPNATSTDD